MTADDTGPDNPPSTNALQPGEQPQGGLPGRAQIDEPALNVYGLPLQNPPGTGRAYLLAAACLIGSIASMGLAATVMREYASQKRLVVPPGWLS